MGVKMSLLLIGGIVFFLFGVWLERKNEKKLVEFERRLAEREENLFELYQAVEEILDEIQNFYMRVNNELNNESKNEQAPLEEKTSIKREKIMVLKQEGYSEDEIARSLNIGKGEVKLVLGLKNNKNGG